MKRIVSLTLACIMLVSAFAVASFAEETYSVTKTVLEHSDWYTKNGTAETVFNEKNGAYQEGDAFPNISFNWGNGDYDKQYFEFTLPKSGKYAVSMLSKQYAGTYIPRVALYVYSETDGDYKRITEKSLAGTGGQYLFTDMAVIDAEEGLLKLRFDMTFADINFSGVKVEALSLPVLTSVKAGESVILENDAVKRGTDTFELEFSSQLAQASGSEKISVECGGKTIASKSAIEGNKVTVDLLETLDFEKECVLKVSGISDIYNAFKVEAVEFPFKTGTKEDDYSMSFASDILCSAVYNDVTVTGKIIGSKMQGIKGRKVEIFLKDKAGNVSDKALAETVSLDDGLFKAEFKIKEGSEAGVYTCLVMAEYQPGPMEKEFNFVSKELEKEILSELSGKADETAIGTFLSEHKEELMINPETDMEGIAQSDKFYRHFKAETYKDGDDFREFYKTHLYLEKLNQATDADKTNEILSNEEACRLLNISSEKIAFIETERSGFTEEVFLLDEYEKAEDLSVKVAEIINKWLKTEYSLSDSESVTEDISAEVGQEIIISLDLEKAVTNADKLIYAIILEDSECAENEEVKLLADGEYAISRDGEKIEIVITPIRPLKSVKEIGELSLVASKAGEYDVKISGNISYVITKDENTTDATAVLNEKTIKLTIDEKTVNKTPGRETTTPSERGGGGTFVPPAAEPTTPPATEPTKEPTEKFEFADIEGFEWAKEGIYGLLEKGVISESEDKNFNPSANIKREEFIKMLVEAFGLKKDGAECRFNDVPSDSWFYPYVASAVESGLTSGIGDNLFGTGNSVTREEMATFIYRAMKNAQAQDNAELFEDDDEISAYAKEAVYHIASKGIINGIGENKFAPKANATRAQAAKVIYGMVKEAQ